METYIFVGRSFQAKEKRAFLRNVKNLNVDIHTSTIMGLSRVTYTVTRKFEKKKRIQQKSKYSKDQIMLLNDIGPERKGCMSCKGTCGYINLCEWDQKWKNWTIKIDEKDNSINLHSNDNPEQAIQLLPKSDSQLDFAANLTYLVVYHRDTRQIRYIDIDAVTRSDTIDVSDK